MPFEKEIKNPGVGFVDTDTIDDLLKPNNTRMVWNGRRLQGNDGKEGSIRNVLGTKRIVLDDWFTPERVIIGSTRDNKRNGIIVFVYDAAGDDGIVEFYPDSQMVELIVKYNFKFNPDYPVNDSFVIDDILFWNDVHNPLRKINIEKAKKYTEGSGGYKSIDEYVISLIKQPPVFPIKPVYFTDTEKKTNNLTGKLFQFRYSYIYDDDEVSVLSPASSIDPPDMAVEFSPNLPLEYYYFNNGIKFTINTGHHTVKKIKLYLRIGNTGQWGELEVIDKEKLSLDDNFNYEYVFYNDRKVNYGDQIYLNRQADAIPDISDSLTYLHTNQLMIGGLTEGFDNIDAYIKLSPQVDIVLPWTGIGVIVQVWDDYFDCLTGGDDEEFTGGMVVQYFNNTTLPTSFNIIRITIKGVSKDYTVSPADSVDPNVFRQNLVTFINSNFSGYHAMLDMYSSLTNEQIIVVEWSCYRVDEPCFPEECEFDIGIAEYTPAANSYKPAPAFKSGSGHNIGIIYYDDFGRKSFVQGNTSIYLPFITEDEFPIPKKGVCLEQNYRYSINWEIHHYAPSWATKYQWVRQKNPDIKNFQRYIIKRAEVSTEGNVKRILLDISPLNLHASQHNNLDYSFPQSSIRSYVFNKGDRVRFITKKKTNFSESGGDGPGLGCVLDYYLDVQIIDYQIYADDDEEHPGEISNNLIIQKFDDRYLDDIGENTLIEIYTPRKEQEDIIYYEISDILNVFKVEIGGRVIGLHEGHTASQTIGGIPATGTLTHGDVYMTPTIFSVALNTTKDSPEIILNESLSASAYYDHQDYDIGRPNIVNKEFKRKKFLVVRASDKYFEGTKYNGLSSFDADKDISVSAEFGDSITALREVGFTLKVIQPLKVTSFFIGRTGLQLASGETEQLVADSSGEITTKSPAKELFGTTNPESVIVVNKNMYFVDADSGAIIMSTVNGNLDISEIGMKNEIKDKLRRIIKSCPGSRIISSYNMKTDEVGFTLVCIDSQNTEHDLGTYYFKDRERFWNSGFNYRDDYHQKCVTGFNSINQYYVSFLNGNIWLHEANRTRNFFHGFQRKLSIEMVFNQRPTFDKLFKTVEYIGSGKWGMPEFEDIIIPKESADGNMMQVSRINYDLFKNVKGKKIASFLRNAAYEGKGKYFVNLHSGNELRGLILRLTINNEDTEFADIKSIAVLYQILNKT